VLISCAPKITPHSGEWSGAGSGTELQDISFKSISQVKSAQNEILLEGQTYMGFEIQDGFRKKLTKDSQAEWTRSTWIDSSDLTREKQWMIWRAQLDSKWNKFFIRNPGYQGWKILSPPRYVARAKHGFHPSLLIALESTKGEVWEISMGRHGEIERAVQAGSNFQSRMKAGFDVSALVFPLGPKKSGIKNVLFDSLISVAPVSNAHVSIDSQATEKLQGPGPYQYPLTDPRSDEMHVFHFINTFYSWIEKTWSITQPFHVSVITHMGYPEKTNAAFYYENLIRLGTGDDVSFSRLALDPTIVVHESCHGIIEALARLPYQGEGGSLNEGFADAITTLYLKSPYLGDSSYLKEPYRRAVNKPLAMNLKNGNLYHDSLIVSGFFWQMREQVGDAKTWNLVLLTLRRLLPNSNFADFSKQLHKAAEEGMTGADLQKTQHLMESLKI
jgi:hypothetical protein